MTCWKVKLIEATLWYVAERWPSPLRPSPTHKQTCGSNSNQVCSLSRRTSLPVCPQRNELSCWVSASYSKGKKKSLYYCLMEIFQGPALIFGKYICRILWIVVFRWIPCSPQLSVRHSSSWNTDTLLPHFVFMCSAILYLSPISHLSHAARVDVIVIFLFTPAKIKFSKGPSRTENATLKTGFRCLVLIFLSSSL